jgi:hypothetical protein
MEINEEFLDEVKVLDGQVSLVNDDNLVTSEYKF